MENSNSVMAESIAAKRFLAIQSRRRMGRLVAVWWAFALGIPAMVIVASRNTDFRSLTQAGTYGALWILLGLIYLYFTKKRSISVLLLNRVDLLEIPVYLSFTGLILIALFGLVPYLDPTYLLPAVDSARDLPLGLLLIGVGYLAMWGGYLLLVAVLKPRLALRVIHPSRDVDFDKPGFIRCIILYTFVLVVRLLQYRYFGVLDASLGPLLQPVLFLTETSWLLMALFTVQTALGRWPRWIFFVVIILESLLVVLSGWSSSLLKILFLVIACFAYADKRIPYSLVLVGCIAAFMLTPITRAMRGADFSSVNSVVNTLVTSTESYWLGDRTGVTTNQELLLARQSGTAQLPGIMLKLTPSAIPYRPASELASIPISFVPRVFWPDKLESGRKGIQFTEEYLGLYGHGAAATSLAGSAYLYGGWLVAVAMMALAGAVFALFYYLVMVPAINSRQVGLLALYVAIILTNLHLGEGDIAGLWQGLVQRTIIFFGFVVVLCFRSRTHAPRN